MRGVYHHIIIETKSNKNTIITQVKCNFWHQTQCILQFIRYNFFIVYHHQLIIDV